MTASASDDKKLKMQGYKFPIRPTIWFEYVFVPIAVRSGLGTAWTTIVLLCVCKAVLKIGSVIGWNQPIVTPDGFCLCV